MEAIDQVNVVHFSTSHIGGAGIAARRLSAALNAIGCRSVFLSLDNPTFKPKDYEVSLSRNLLQRIQGASLSWLQNQFIDQTYFTFGSVSALTPSKLSQMLEPTPIIHIHNWFNLLNLRDMQELLAQGYKMVFTLHDMRNLSGGCHYSLDCEGYLSNCSGCPFLPRSLSWLPPKNLNRMRKLITEYSDQIAFITPSVWLQQTAISTGLISAERIDFVANYHYEVELLNLQPKEIERRVSEILVIGVASLNIKSPLKGGNLLQEIVVLLSGKVKFVFLSDYEINDEGHEKFWEDIDYLFVPSVADNSPNVIHEAKFNNVPVIGTKIGGITELLNPAFDVTISPIDLNPSYVSNLLVSIGQKLTKIRPRFIDDRYQSYVANALIDVMYVYKKLMYT